MQFVVNLSFWKYINFTEQLCASYTHTVLHVPLINLLPLLRKLDTPFVTLSHFPPFSKPPLQILIQQRCRNTSDKSMRAPLVFMGRWKSHYIFHSLEKLSLFMSIWTAAVLTSKGIENSWILGSHLGIPAAAASEGTIGSSKPLTEKSWEHPFTAIEKNKQIINSSETCP